MNRGSTDFRGPKSRAEVLRHNDPLVGASAAAEVLLRPGSVPGRLGDQFREWAALDWQVLATPTGGTRLAVKILCADADFFDDIELDDRLQLDAASPEDRSACYSKRPEHGRPDQGRHEVLVEDQFSWRMPRRPQRGSPRIRNGAFSTAPMPHAVQYADKSYVWLRYPKSVSG